MLQKLIIKICDSGGTRVFNPYSEVLLIISMTSWTWGWRRRRREFGATISMDYRELTTQSIILSFYTLRLPFTAQELRRRSFSTGSSMEMRPQTVQVCIDMWKSKWGWGKSSKAAHSDMKPQNTGPRSQALRSFWRHIRKLGRVFHERLQDNEAWSIRVSCWEKYLEAMTRVDASVGGMAAQK